MRNAKRKSDESGVALLLAIFTLLLLTVLGLSLLCAADLETNIAANYRDKQVSVYSALSGLQEARDRLIPSRCDVTDLTQPCNDPIALDTRSLAIPSTTNGSVLYIINPLNSETVAPWDIHNKYFDNELCHENILGLTASAGTCPATTASVPSGTDWFSYSSLHGSTYNDSQSSAGEYQPVAGGTLPLPLPYKWVRVSVKTDNMTRASVQYPANGSIVCWDGKHQVPVSTTSGFEYNTACAPVGNLQLSYNGTLCSTCTFNPPQGTGYVNPVVTIGPPTVGVTATATAHVIQTPTGQIATVYMTNGGSGYTTAPTVSFTGGGGTGAAAIAHLGAPVQSFNNDFTVHATDGCYATATPSVAFSGGGGSGATATATMYTHAGSVAQDCVASWTLSFQSGTCTTGGTITLTDPTAGHGRNFSGTVTLNSTKNGITSYAIVDPGQGYSPGSVPTITNPSGCTFSSTFTYGYKMTGVNLVNGGGGYYTPPTVVIQAPTAPSGANPPTVTDTLGAITGQITSITLTNGGSAYTSAPTVVFTGGGGTGAAATASMATTGQIDSITLTNVGSGYTTNPPVTITDAGGGTGATIQAKASNGSTMGRVYLLTALAVAPGGSRTMTQMEVATPVRMPVSMPGALVLDAPSAQLNAGNSSQYIISGTDANTGSIPGCSYPPQPAKSSVGVYDNPSSPSSPTAVACVTSELGGTPTAGCTATTSQSGNYTGSAPSPDVANVYGSLGDLTTPAGVDALASAIAADATYTYNPTYPNAVSSIHLGSYPNDCPTIVVNGNLTLSGNASGCGVLLVTGNMILSGDYTWTGPVFVIGWGGTFQASGGGNGQINGSLFVALDRTPPSLDPITGAVINPDGVMRSTLGTPAISFDVNGGGGNGIQYNSCYSDAMLSSLRLVMPPSSQPLKVLSVRQIF